MVHFLHNPVFWLYAVTVVPFLAFLILYASRSAWTTTAPGRALMVLNGTLVAVLLNALVTLGGVEWPGRDTFRVVVFLGVFASGVYQLKTLVFAQREAHREPEEHAPNI